MISYTVYIWCDIDDDCKIGRVHFFLHCCNECFRKLHSDFQTSRIVSLRQSLMLLQTLPDSDHVCGAFKKQMELADLQFCAHARWWGHIIQLEGLVDYIVIWKYLEGMNHHFSILQWFVQVDQNSEASFAAVHQEEPSWSRVAVHGIGFLSHLRLNSLSFIPFYLIYCLNLPCILYPYNSCIFMFLLKGICFFFSTFNDVNVLWSFKVQCCLRREIKKEETWPTADFPARATIHHDWDVFHEPTRKFWFMSFVSTASVSVQWVFLSRRTEHKVSTSDKWRMFLKCFRLGREDLWMVCFEKDIYYIREDSS